MQRYLRGELKRLVTKPAVHEWLADVHSRKRLSNNRVTTESILQARDADRT